MAEASFHVEVVTPERQIYSGQAVSVTAPGTEGYFGVMAHHLPPTLQMPHETKALANVSTYDALTLTDAVRRLEMDRISDALKQCNGVVRRAAKVLGLTERMLAYKIQKYSVVV
jgi:transcriptional regulator with GAF, ATPase, and Fis domain